MAISPLFSPRFSTILREIRKQPLNGEKKQLHVADELVKARQTPGFISHTPLANALRWTPEETLTHLSRLVSPHDFEKLQRHETVESPLQRLGIQNSKWLQDTKMIGMNPRALGTYFNILKAAMIYPERGIHLLPYYTNDKACIYEPQDWKLSREFLDPYLSKRGLHTPEQQLRYVVSALHAMGKAVGMDILPHTVAFSRESLVHPDKFEWFQLNATKTGQLFPQSRTFESLSPWARERVTSYYIQTTTPPKAYESFFQTLKADAHNQERKLVNYNQVLEVIQRVFKWKPEKLEREGWSRYTALLEKENYAALSGKEKEVFQRLLEAKVAPGVDSKNVAAFFQQQLAVLKHPDSVLDGVKAAIIDFVRKHGDSAGKQLSKPDQFFDFPAEKRALILFGTSEKKAEHDVTALKRQQALVLLLKERGLYPMPVADSEVLRPILFDRFRQGEAIARLFDKPNLDPSCTFEFFETLTPYAFYPAKANGYLDTQHPNKHVFAYYKRQVANLQKEIGLDFVRADMAHVQTAHATDKPSENALAEMSQNKREFWACMKQFVQKQAPYFAIWGESFLSGNKSIDLVQDLNNKKIDVSSGDLDRYQVDSGYVNALQRKTTAPNRNFKEALPVVGHDSDQSHHRHLNQNPLATQIRYFTHLFQAAPGYTMAGYESRPVSTNHSYLFPQKEPFNWGHDRNQFQVIHAMRQQYQRMQPGFQPLAQEWLSTNRPEVGAWLWKVSDATTPKWLMVTNTDLKQGKTDVKLSNPFALNPQLKLQAKKQFSSVPSTPKSDQNNASLKLKAGTFTIPALAPGENQIYQLMAPNSQVT